MKIVLICALGILLCAGCSKIVYSEPLSEPAEVYDVAYVPSGHGSDLAVGVSSSGKMTVTPISVDIPERYAVVFKCQHGKFVIDGERGKACYEALQRGDKVVVRYSIKYEVTSNSTNAIGLHFWDATKAQVAETP